MIWFVLALIIVAVAALLLLWIISEAKGIAKEADRALKAAAIVEKNTAALWAIPQVNQLLSEGNQTLGRIVQKATTVADVVSPKGGK
jgi:uncharacterized protein YoxC